MFHYIFLSFCTAIKFCQTTNHLQREEDKEERREREEGGRKEGREGGGKGLKGGRGRI